MVNDIKIVSLLDKGAFGSVFLCLFKGKKCVMKQIDFLNCTKNINLEFQIMQCLNHPRIIKLISFFVTEKSLNLLIEYAPNGSLRDMIFKYQKNKWKISYSDLMQMLSDIVFGVKYLHNNFVIHRDLKPENILMDLNYRPKIADFGVSKIVSDNNPKVQTVVGTMCYMCPEVYLHEPYDRSCDIWSLGIIFYEMAMMKYPFSNADKARIMNRNLQFIPPKIDYLRRKYDPCVQGILELMLQRDPKKRIDVNQLSLLPIINGSYF